MGRVQLFEVRLGHGRVVYSPGEPLVGAVRVRLGAPLPFRGGRRVPPGRAGRAGLRWPRSHLRRVRGPGSGCGWRWACDPPSRGRAGRPLCALPPSG